MTAAPAPTLAAPPFAVAPTLAGGGIRHGFFGRQGGVSTDLFASLNCGFGSEDDPARVAENRRRALAALAAETAPLITLHQVHSADAVVVRAPPTPGEILRADGLVTDRPGLALGVLSADCAPILFADPQTRIIGACHAGWRGALTGIVAATVSAMVGLGAERGRIRAAIGPTIRQASYEVGPEFPAPFLARDPATASLFRPADRPGHHLFDLPGYLMGRLAAEGLGHHAELGSDTYAETERWFSFRRNTHAGERRYGRNLSVILI